MSNREDCTSGAQEATRRPFRVAFIVVPGFSLMALSSGVEPLRSVNRLVGEARYEWVLVAHRPGPVAASNGFEVKAAYGIGDAPPADLTIMVASLEVEHFRQHAMFEHLRRLRKAVDSLLEKREPAFTGR